MSNSLKAPRGTKDILPSNIDKWEYIRTILYNVCYTFGFKQIITPIFEDTSVFLRGVGNSTEIVQKEMYTFNDKSDRSITLRPEGTAAVARAVIENGLMSSIMPLKLFYFGSFFRYEKPQVGRLREFHQFGAELYGSDIPYSDVEIILFSNEIFSNLNLNNISLYVNSIGCEKCRPDYNEKLNKFLSLKKNDLCGLCIEKLKYNPIRILDCKNTKCSEIVESGPSILECLCNECLVHFNTFTDILSSCNISYEIKDSLVRGLDYYNRTVFEFVTNDIGAKSTICGGGRYDSLISKLGGKSISSLGFAIGIERLILLLETQEKLVLSKAKSDIFIACTSDKYHSKCLDISYNLKKLGINAEYDIMGRTLKSQMKYANKINAQIVIVLGDDEINTGSIKLKNMSTGENLCSLSIDNNLILNLYNIITQKY